MLSNSCAAARGDKVFGGTHERGNCRHIQEAKYKQLFQGAQTLTKCTNAFISHSYTSSFRDRCPRPLDAAAHHAAARHSARESTWAAAPRNSQREENCSFTENNPREQKRSSNVREPRSRSVAHLQNLMLSFRSEISKETDLSPIKKEPKGQNFN